MNDAFIFGSYVNEFSPLLPFFHSKRISISFCSGGVVVVIVVSRLLLLLPLWRLYAQIEYEQRKKTHTQHTIKPVSSRTVIQSHTHIFICIKKWWLASRVTKLHFYHLLYFYFKNNSYFLKYLLRL